MISKKSDVLYLFDFDGTITGSDDYKNIIQFNKQALRLKPLINPHDFDIRWSILTSRPKTDYLFVSFCCSVMGLSPETIDTSPTWTYKFKNIEEQAKFKSDVIRRFLFEEYRIKNIKRPIHKVVYIDNNHKLNQLINSYRVQNEDYIAIDVKDFYQGNFHLYIN